MPISFVGVLIAMLHLLLEGVHNPQPLPELQRVDRPIRIGAVLEHHLEYTGADTLQRLGDVGLLAFGRDRQRPQDPILRPFWKADERLAGRLDPRDRPRNPYFSCGVGVKYITRCYRYITT